MLPAEIRDIIRSQKICILIPTYNNAATLNRVVDGVLSYTDQVILINDGSTDGTAGILKLYRDLTVINLPKNSGKGNALRIGFRKARALGYDFAITIDSDGQHYPDDIPIFVNALCNENQDVLLIGNRNMAQEGIPKKSSFGNRFSNFWFWFETGVTLQDTQSGYRLYPLRKIPKKYYTKKFEFEIEVIVRSAWRGIAVKNVPIKVLYDPAERVSHFRPFQDFTRISLLNTILVSIALLYIKPRDLLRNFKSKKLKDFVKEDLLESAGSNRTKALSVALGSFIAFSPFWGFQTALAISLSLLLNLNKALAFAFSHLSLPPLIPLIILISLKIGSVFLPATPAIRTTDLNLDFVKQHLLQYLIGSFTLATGMAVLLGFGTYFLLEIRSKTKNNIK